MNTVYSDAALIPSIVEWTFTTLLFATSPWLIEGFFAFIVSARPQADEVKLLRGALFCAGFASVAGYDLFVAARKHSAATWVVWPLIVFALAFLLLGCGAQLFARLAPVASSGDWNITGVSAIVAKASVVAAVYSLLCRLVRTSHATANLNHD